MSPPRAGARDCALLALAIACSVSVTSVRAADEPHLYFFGIGDQGTGPDYAQYNVSLQMVNTSRVLGKPQFVIGAGDNMYEDGTMENDPRWNTMFTEMYPVEDLDVPFYLTLGNHAFYSPGETRFQINTTEDPRYRLPNHYYSFRKQISAGRYATFIMLDTSQLIVSYRDEASNPYHYPRMIAQLNLTDPMAQLAWLERTLQQADPTDWIIAAGHHPLKSTDNPDGPEANMTLVGELFKQYGVQAYFAGHVHRQEFEQWEGIDIYLEGASGCPWHSCATYEAHNRTGDPDGWNDEAGFLVSRLYADRLHVQYLDIHGGILFQHTTVKNNPMSTDAAGSSTPPSSPAAQQGAHAVSGTVAGALAVGLVIASRWW